MLSPMEHTQCSGGKFDGKVDNGTVDGIPQLKMFYHILSHGNSRGKSSEKFYEKSHGTPYEFPLG